MALLGSIFLRPTVLEKVCGFISSGDFYGTKHGIIYETMLEVKKAGNPVDMVTVAALLKEHGKLEEVGGPVFLASLSEKVAFAINAEHYAMLVQKKSRDRRLRNLALELIERLEGGVDVGPLLEEIVQAQSRSPMGGNGLATIPLADVEPEPVSWLWKPYIPRGKFTLMEGDPEAGKTCVALAVGVRATKEGLTVLYATADDGLADTIRPRAEAMGADLGLFHAVTVPFTLREVEALDRTCARLRPALVVIDPITAFLGAEVDLHRANEVRESLMGFVRLAEGHGFAFIAVRHLTKKSADRAIYRGLGSIDFAALARSILLIGRTSKGQRALVQIKNSYSEHGPALLFEIRGDGDDLIFLWAGEAPLTADDLLRPEAGEEEVSAKEEAKAFLQSALAGGAVSAQSLMTEARQLGISERTLYRAKRALGVAAVPERAPGGKIEGWVWQLPGCQIDNLDPGSSKETVGSMAEPPGKPRVMGTSTRLPLDFSWQSGRDADLTQVSRPDCQIATSIFEPDGQRGKPVGQGEAGRDLEEDGGLKEILL
jgi:hypothetical protein